MRALWFANIINIVLDPCLINGWGPFPKLNVMGASVATTTGRGLGVVFQLWMLFGGMSRIRVFAHQIRINGQILWRLLRVSFTGILQFVIATASWTGLVRLCATFGTVPVAGYTVAIKIFMFVILPSWGLSNSAATLVGQNLGAKQPESAPRKAVYQDGVYAMYYMGSDRDCVLLVFARQLWRRFLPRMWPSRTLRPIVCASSAWVTSAMRGGWCWFRRSMARAIPARHRSSISSVTGASRLPLAC